MKKVFFSVVVLFFFLVAGMGVVYYLGFVKKIVPEKSLHFYIYPETGYYEIDSLIKQHISKGDYFIFTCLARYKNFPERIKPGYYRWENPSTINHLINGFISGAQTPIKVVFNSVTTLNQLAGIVGQQLMIDSVQLISLFSSGEIIAQYQFTQETFPAMFIPNTYEFWWNTAPESFIERMHREYLLFWNETRLEKAKQLKMTPVEVSTLASIVEKETAIMLEMPVVAGVYLNRLKLRMPLQADPTVIFAHGNPDVKRVTLKMLEINSPYNTYKNAGLPPGPICLPSIQAIDAVLNAQKHDYLYFCASPELDGTHRFAKTLQQHNRNADEYQRKLSQMRIYR